ncbi:MAG: AmmeMemoRadiSam system protein A [Rhodocyclaceae bacterium]
MSTESLGPTLLQLARTAIAGEFGIPAHAPVPLAATEAPGFSDIPAALSQPGACFVTLTQQGALRGCIGSLEAWRPLADDVRANAVAAAFRDPRFAPLAAAELERTRVEVSLLTPAEPMAFASEAEALAQLRPTIDGVIFECGGRRSTFLPQVWEQLPEAHQFMAQLKQKAGFPADFWSDSVKLSRYRVEKWKEA